MGMLIELWDSAHPYGNCVGQFAAFVALYYLPVGGGVGRVEKLIFLCFLVSFFKILLD